VEIKAEQKAKSGSLPSYEKIRAAIPSKCFEKSFSTSLAYLLLDYTVIILLYLLVPYVENRWGWTGLLLWYWVTGMFMSSLFCIGHDCGHGTFSNRVWVNDVFGHLAHAPLMAPFWPWQKSHRLHHQYTSHVDKDKGHPWIKEDDYKEGDWLHQNFARIPLSGLIRWNPVYTFLGLPDGSHFWPFSRLFTNNTERFKCVVSGLACLLCSWAVLALCDYSLFSFIKYYYVPLLFQGFWMVIITYLQHQDEEVEVYEEGHWNFVQGSAQTIDRHYGLGIDSALHHITDGHVAHHFFFTKIPHYHLMEATKAIRSVMGDYPGVYKRRSCYHFLFEFLRLNTKLDYLKKREPGLLKYNISKDFGSQGTKSGQD